MYLLFDTLVKQRSILRFLRFTENIIKSLLLILFVRCTGFYAASVKETDRYLAHDLSLGDHLGDASAILGEARMSRDNQKEIIFVFNEKRILSLVTGKVRLHDGFKIKLGHVTLLFLCSKIKFDV
jgi:hypothetical protein